MHRVSFGDGAGQWGKQSPGLWGGGEEEGWATEPSSSFRGSHLNPSED